MNEFTYWLVGVEFQFRNVKGKIQKDHREWTVWARNYSEAWRLFSEQRKLREPKSIIKDSQFWLTPRKLSPKEIKQLGVK